MNATVMVKALSILQSTQSFLDKCQSVAVPSILPDKRILVQPGGQLIHSMAGHKGDILSLDLTEDSKTALTSKFITLNDFHGQSNTCIIN